MSAYILEKAIALRSWRRVPCAYYIYGVREARGLTGEQFDLLSRCDGRQELEAHPAGELQDEELADVAGGCGRDELKCPKCGSPNVTYFQAMGSLYGYKCKDCGFDDV